MTATPAAAALKTTSSPTLGSILTNADGQVLYVFGKDSAGTSNCSGGCAGLWPPVTTGGTTTASSDVTAKLGTITRSDGTVQVTVNGLPVYTYAGDTAPGDTNGQNFKDLWWVLSPDGTPIKPAALKTTSSPTLGSILTNADGQVLYVFGKDSAGTSTCSGGCAGLWPPVTTGGTTTASSDVTAKLGTITRSDGSVQVTVNGLPVYTYAGDTAPGDTNGQNFKDLWWVLGPDGAPLKPADLTVVSSPTLGNILANANANGQVLYVFGNDSAGTSTCSGGCAGLWPPVTTGGAPMATSTVTAKLGTIMRSDGSVQVTVNGLPVYTYSGDTAPGDTNGQNFKNLWWVIGTDGTPIKTAG